MGSVSAPGRRLHLTRPPGRSRRPLAGVDVVRLVLHVLGGVAGGFAEGVRVAGAPLSGLPQLLLHALGGQVEGHGEEVAAGPQRPEGLRGGRLRQGLVLLQGVQRALVHDDVEGRRVEVQGRGVHVEPAHPRHLGAQPRPEVLQQGLADVHVHDLLEAGLVHLLGHLGVAAAEHEYLRLRRQVGPQEVTDDAGFQLLALAFGHKGRLRDLRVPAAIPIEGLALGRLVVVVVPVARVRVREGVAQLLHLLVREAVAPLVDGAADDADHGAEVARHALVRPLDLLLQARELLVHVLGDLAVDGARAVQRRGGLRQLLEPQHERQVLLRG
mmetsp:Transcript_23353/g.73567  ORF Transcript_23353/g.73567 Transcript_23353/m.73567 type:complete len:327 (-) Transcript_23353:286-1266(-)